jgi:undecaprenyl-diphosphatase
MWESIREWDRDLFVFLNNLSPEWMDSFWILVTDIKFWTPLFLLIFYLFFRTFDFRTALWIHFFFLTATGVNIALMLLTKHWVARLRPNNVPELAELIRTLQAPVSFSFYSGHASNSFVIAVFTILVLRKQLPWTYVFLIFPLLFTLSRLFVGVHYPSDLAFGAIMGTIIAVVSYKVFKKVALREANAI